MLSKVFFYGARASASLANGATSTQQITLASDSDFKIRELRTTGSSGVFVTISNANGDQWSNISFNMGLVGAGQNGLKLFEDVVLPRNSQLTIQITNNSGGAISNLEVQLLGVKV